MVGCRDAGKAQRILGVRRREDTPAGEHEILRPCVQLGRGDASQPVFEPGCGEIHRAGSGTGKPARIIAGGDRPGILAGIDCRLDPDGFGGEAEDVGDDLRRRGAMTPCDTESIATETPPSGSRLTVAAAWAPLLGPARSRSSGLSTVVI